MGLHSIRGVKEEAGAKCAACVVIRGDGTKVPWRSECPTPDPFGCCDEDGFDVGRPPSCSHFGKVVAVEKERSEWVGFLETGSTGLVIEVKRREAGSGAPGFVL